MARSVAVDYFQVFPFWLMDVAPIEMVSMPIFTPLLGFATITAPELTLDVEEIDEANGLFRRKVVKRGSVNSLTLTRAASWYDSDFYKWIMAALQGTTGSGLAPIGGATPRRTLLLVQFLSRPQFSVGRDFLGGAAGAAASAAAGGAMAYGAAAGAVAMSPGTREQLAGTGSLAFGIQTTAAVVAGGALAQLGITEFAQRIPGKAWMIYDALPVRYKSGGDFDASSGAVSIAELEVAYEFFEELSLAG